MGYLLFEAVLRIIVRWVVVGLVCLYALGALAESPGMDSARTNVIQAGMVNGFTTYTTWPNPDTTDPFVIGVMGAQNLFIPALQRFFAKKPVFPHRQIDIREVTLKEVTDCHLLVIFGQANEQGDAILAKVASLPILTISDQAHFAESGGHVNFYHENNKLRFAINWKTTHHSNLKISSRLLRLARVIGKPK
ncbi:MAG: hypothetical protein ACI8WB_002734 [Phenylobacterium sp.]